MFSSDKDFTQISYNRSIIGGEGSASLHHCEE